MTTRWPRRHVVVVLIFLGIIIAYTDRVNISVAAVAMRERFGWSQTEKGFALAAFSVGYLSFMFVAGLLANRFGGKRVIGFSVLAWSIFTLLTPAAATFSIAMLIAARIGMGVGEAGMYPGTYDLFGRWVPSADSLLRRCGCRLLSAAARRVRISSKQLRISLEASFQPWNGSVLRRPRRSRSRRSPSACVTK